MIPLKCAICVALSASVSFLTLVETKEITKDEVDKIIEEDITERLREDLLQSIERKFQVDLERSVDMALIKIKLLLQNGTTHIQDSLAELQGMIDLMKKHTSEKVVDSCLKGRQNETSALAEKALHQMVVCGYALIGHDPERAVARVLDLKNMIKQGVKPIHAKKKDIDNVLKLCGHEHESLKNVIKCVISKSPVIKTSMMDITNKLIEGVVELTKLMAHGAMHEACLIEVVKTLEDEAFDVINNIKECAYGNGNKSYFDVANYLADNNATVLDVGKRDINVKKNATDTGEMEKLLRKMKKADEKLKDKIHKMHNLI